MKFFSYKNDMYISCSQYLEEKFVYIVLSILIDLWERTMRYLSILLQYIKQAVA